MFITISFLDWKIISAGNYQNTFASQLIDLKLNLSLFNI